MAETPAITDRNLEATTHISLKREPACFAFLSARSIAPPMPIDSINLDLASADYFNGRASLWTTLEMRSSINNDRPTAILANSDVLALGVLHAAEELGLAVPRDLSVVGFDDSQLARRARPRLTTVRQDVEAKGKAAAAALLDAIARAKAGTSRRIRRLVLPTELVVRDSTAAPSSQDAVRASA